LAQFFNQLNSRVLQHKHTAEAILSSAI